MADDEVAALYNADGELVPEAWSVLANKDKERIRRLKDEHKDELTSKFNEGHAKAKKEERAKFEDEIRQHFGVESKSMGVDLIKDVLATGTKDDVKTHPEYIALEKKLHNDFIPKQDYDVVKGEFDKFKSQVERDKVFGRVKSDAKAIFYGLNPKLPSDKGRALNQERDFLAKLEGFGYQVQDDSNHVILDKEGKRLVNENMNPITFPELVKSLTLQYFDVETQPPAGNSGVSDSPTTGGAAYEDAGAFYKAYSAERDPSKRVEMYEQAKKAKLI